MMLVDAEYDGETFDLRHAFFGEELEATYWVAQITGGEIGESLMVVWIDHHGNEARSVISRDRIGENQN